MIGSLRGKLLLKKPPTLLIETGGVGYECEAPMSTFYRLPEQGLEVFVYTHLVVREDVQQLFAFSQLSERSLFRDLIKISNVGPKLALAILSGIEPDALVQCVADADAASLERVPGVGKKTAQRLLIELRDKWGDNMPLADSSGAGSAMHDAVEALVALGYKPQQARQVLSKRPEDAVTSEELVRFALQNIS